ncbi:hypothetical protein HZH66_008313 [Vespula vulgaris]|uniref:Uncharacterized protein n=1 Tax=Vespula vulgaris TaxID=7454 RepID=A0A834JUZ5_VESVU|nr:hypothetical protein HZH66_008313 [Vespula vulgaris]
MSFPRKLKDSFYSSETKGFSCCAFVSYAKEEKRIAAATTTATTTATPAILAATAVASCILVLISRDVSRERDN